MSFRPTAARIAAFAVAGLLGLSACSSTPSPRRVALDTIESLELPAAQEQCMKDVIASYSNDELDNIGSDNENLDFTSENFDTSGSPEYQAYIERLQDCLSDGAASSETTEPSDSAAESGTTEAAGTTDSGDTTEAADTSEGADTTEAPGTTEAPETTEA